MATRAVLSPSAAHPITVTPDTAHILIRAGDVEIAQSGDTLRLQEATYPAVHYVPRRDMDMSRLVRSDHSTYCPFKGEAAYFHLPVLGEAGRNAVWSYEAPFPAVAAIADHLAFYPDKVSLVVQPDDENQPER